MASPNRREPSPLASARKVSVAAPNSVRRSAGKTYASGRCAGVSATLAGRHGKRISIKDTRAIIDAILNGSLDNAETFTLPMFNLAIPTELPGVDTKILDPRNTYASPEQWQEKAETLAKLFIDNFDKYTDTPAGAALVAAGPKL